MPIEIRELVIRATVKKEIGEENKQGISRRDINLLKREIIEECMDKLRSVLEDQHSR